jgi:mitogen-activated protein kinase 6
MTEHVVTRWYRPPELMLCADGMYTAAVDVWSVGCIFAELLGRGPLFPGKNFMHQLTLIFEVIGTPLEEELAYIKSDQARRFMRALPVRGW